MKPGSPPAHTRSSLAALCVGLGSLYLAQGVVAGLGTVLVALMAAQGQSLEAQAGVLAWGALPWVLKLGWALVWDRLMPAGHPRRLWGLFALQLGIGAAALALSSGEWTEGAQLGFFALNLVASWQDVGTDAVAVDRTPPERRGLVNAVMAGARALGAGWLAAIVLMPLLSDWGVAPTLRTYAIGLAALSLLILPMRGQLSSASGPAAATPRAGELLAAIFAEPRARFALVLASLALLGDGISGAVAADFLQKRAGWSLEALTTQLVPLQVAVEVSAFALAAWAVDRIGALRSVGLGAAVLGTAWLSFGLAEGLWTSHSVVLALTITESTARALMLVGAYGFLMGATNATVRATHFVVYMSLLNLPRVLGPLVAPTLFEAGGYKGVWLLAASVQLVFAGLAMWGWRRYADSDPNSEGAQN